MNDNKLKSIPDKANKILYTILFIFLAYGLKLWILSVFQHDEKVIESKKPGKKTEIIASKRATIRDRFNEPLAINKLNYDLAVVYSELRTIPSTLWKTGPDGKKVKISARKNYIKQLTRLLHKKTGIDPDRLEDEIHAKAALFNALPYPVKSNLTEEQYLELKALSFFWPGLKVRRESFRTYPHGKTASHIIGTLGLISKNEYEARLLEREELRLFLEGLDLGADLPLPEGYDSLNAVKKRIRELNELAYTSGETVGKMGIEAKFEESLRGYQGKKTTLYDNKGHLIKDYPGSREPKAGKRLLLSISKDLQEEAEKLLVISEESRETKVKIDDKPTVKADKAPFIKGGAIIAIDPNTAEILAMASYPRFDPNHYISGDDKRSHNLEIIGYLEDAKTVKAIWDGLIPLKKEHFHTKTDTIMEEDIPLTWNLYLELILKPSGEVKALINEIQTLDHAIKALNKAQLNPYVYDLIRLNVAPERFSPDLRKKLGKITLNDYRSHEQAYNLIEEGVREKSKILFRDIDFKKWREKNEKKFIAEKRSYEKEHKIFPKPYLDYLDEEERKQFENFWNGQKEPLILAFLKSPTLKDEYTETLQVLAEEFKRGAHLEHYLAKPFSLIEPFFQKLSFDEARAYLKTFRTLDERDEPLKAPWRLKGKKEKTLSDLAKAFYPHYGYGFLRSFAYRQAATQGSIFKLVTAYTALKQGKQSLPEIKDQLFKIGSQVYVGYDRNGKPIPQLYKGGRIPRSSHNQMGDVDLLTAIEKSSNPYFALLAMDVIDKPSDLIDSAKAFSFGEKTGIALPGEIAGNLPKDLDTNPTGLFATSIGQHTLVVTPLQTSVMLSALANKGAVMKPQIIKCKAGREKAEWDEIPHLTNYPLDAPLNLLGVDFPLFTPLLDPELKEPVIVTRPEVRRQLYLPDGIRKMLLEGMRRVVTRTLSDSLFLLSKAYNHHPEIMSSFIEMKPYLVGKTSTAESIERLDLDEPNERPLYTHVWFGGIGFEDEAHRKPELVVVVYLRYGGYGKEAAPMAAHIMKKWREIKEKHGESVK